MGCRGKDPRTSVSLEAVGGWISSREVRKDMAREAKKIREDETSFRHPRFIGKEIV